MKRIKLLAEQAGAVYSNDHAVSLLDDEIEKFAQLIVWEAVGLCTVDVDVFTSPSLSEYEKGIVEGYRRANENLRFYFGVEE